MQADDKAPDWWSEKWEHMGNIFLSQAICISLGLNPDSTKERIDTSPEYQSRFEIIKSRRWENGAYASWFTDANRSAPDPYVSMRDLFDDVVDNQLFTLPSWMVQSPHESNDLDKAIFAAFNKLGINPKNLTPSQSGISGTRAKVVQIVIRDHPKLTDSRIENRYKALQRKGEIGIELK